MFLSVIHTTGFASGAVVAAVQSPPTVCRDKDGNLKDGDLDVLSIFDDSRSLSRSGQRLGSDVDGKRFDAMEEFLSSFAKTTSNRQKNFGLIKYGSTAKVVLPLEEITLNNFEAKIKSIRGKIPNKWEKQEKQTDYVIALKHAIQIFRDRDEKNCKILIWFTDGVHDRSDSSKAEDDRTDALRLEREVCKSGELAKEIQGRDINTFVIFLKGNNDPNYEKRRSISQDAMQIITGDQEPNFASKSSVRKIESSSCSLDGKRHLGEVISANDASELIGYLVDLVLVADGGISVVEGDCPIQIDEADSVRLPMGRFIEWLSVTTWNKTPEFNVDSLKIRSGGSAIPFKDVFESDPSTDAGGRSQRYLIKNGKQNQLNSGWSLSSNGARQTCIRVKMRDLEFRIKKTEPQFVPIAPKDLPEQLFKNRIELFDTDDQIVSVSVERALALPQVIGLLKVDFGELFSQNANGKVEVRIQIDGRFEILPSNCSLSVNVVDTDKFAGKKISSIRGCRVVPSSGAETRYDATAALQNFEKNCPRFNSGWRLLKNGAPIESSGVFARGSDELLLSLESIKEAPSKSVQCSIEKAAIQISSGSISEEIAVTATLNLLSPKSSFWPLIALLLVLLFTLLSLFALRFMNMLIVKAPKKDDFFSYVTNAELLPGEFERATMKWPTSAREFEIDANKLQPTKGDKGRQYLLVGSYKFELRLPRLLHPFEYARLQLVDVRPSVFWRANSQRDGLTLSFTSAIGLIATSSNIPTAERATEVDVVVLVPKRGADAGLEGVVKNVRSNVGDLAPQLLATIRQHGADKQAVDTKETSSKLNSKKSFRREKSTENTASGTVTPSPMSRSQSAGPLVAPPGPPPTRPQSSPSVVKNPPNSPPPQPPSQPRPPEPTRR